MASTHHPHYHHDTESLDYSSDGSDDVPFLQNALNPTRRVKRYTRPLIDYVRNEWQSNTKYSSGSSPDRSETPRWVQMVLSIVAAPRFRRYAIIYTALFLSCLLGWQFVLSPRLQEHSELTKSLNPNTKETVGGWYGTNALPSFEGVLQLKTLDSSLLPAKEAPKPGAGSTRRLIVVGDVHGCRTELERLLEEVTFNEKTDHLIFTGDLISKGPDSPGVVDLARKHSASCVRGNHEDRVLLVRQELLEMDAMTDTSGDEYMDGLSTSGAQKDLKLARNLTDEQAEWLDACPVILNVGHIPTMGQVAVVHGGLVPGVDYDKQDPFSVMNMLTIDLDTHLPSSSRDGKKWTKLFNKHQSLTYKSTKHADAQATDAQATTVIYGHDSKSSLSITTYTKGLDSGCVKGGELTALVIADGGEQKVIQVRCNNYLEK
ncbi:Ser/Thr protein phosphatase family [Aspergillus japonicus CBS 114.51]|uniref:Ser/Thr protein phosphatase family n=2 Tax=Aspergillus TaxID=5052 RepID=A0A2V5H5M5_ASPV1|nr:Ser/Thr protein phosphatase family [Aspergillus japonicus CBS 114.51]PYI19485.1 Ser/Thr protein phosphatase family [Aspergillus violaceofuscus CBS 115571]RAH84857.1 Ser/Thr protein phosphatase family [Aspergillus japonicus CBS 114.51]